MAMRTNETDKLNDELNAINLNVSDDANQLSRDQRLLREINDIRDQIEPYLSDINQCDLTTVIDEMFDIFTYLKQIDLYLLRDNFGKWITRPEQSKYIKELKAIHDLIKQLDFN